MGDKFQTDFLTPESSVLNGIGSIINLLGCEGFRYNVSPTPADADARALKSDWMIVGQDMAVALDGFKKETKEK